MLFTGKVYGTADFGGVGAASSGMGAFVVKYSSAGGCLWAKAYGANDLGAGVAADSGGNVLVTGTWGGATDFGGGSLTSQGGGSDIFLLKLAP